MKIHAMYGVDFPNTSASGAGPLAPLRTPIPNGPWEVYHSNTEVSASYNSTDGWFNCSMLFGTYNFGGYRFKVSANLKSVVADLSPTSNLYFGWRFKTVTKYDQTTIAALHSDQDVANVTQLFAKTDLPAYAIAKTYYLELNLNFATQRIERRVNGLPLVSLAMPAWMLTAVGASPGGTSVYLGIGAPNVTTFVQGETQAFSFRDVYCVEWEAGELAQYLGPQVVEKVAINAATATGWVASTGTATSVLKTGYSNPSTPVGAPTLTSDDAMTPASITYTATAIPQNAIVNGVVVKGRSAVSVNATGNLGVSLTVGGTETADVTTSMVAAQTWYDRLVASTKTPGGLPWTQASLAALTVKAKPKV